jgi:hypothetical protein
MPLFGGPPNVEELKAEGNVKGLIKALRYKKDPSVRQAAAEALGQLGDARAVKPLIVAIRWDRNHDVCQAAAKALEMIGTPAVKPLVVALKTAAQEGNQRVVEAADETLKNLGWQSDEDKSEIGATYWLAKRQWDKFVEIGTPAMAPLSVALRDADADVRRHAAEALIQICNAEQSEFPKYLKKYLEQAHQSDFPFKPFLEQGEEVIYYSKGSKGGEVLTNQRIFCLGGEGVGHSIALADITSVDVEVRLSVGRMPYHVLTLGIRGETEPWFMSIGAGGLEGYDASMDEREWIERFPRKICEITGLKFAVPKVYSRQWRKEGTALAFYIKTDLVWPSKCASCRTEVQEPKYDSLTLSRISDQRGTYSFFGESSVTFEIPYCSNCYKQRRLGLVKARRAVKEEHSFNGAIALLWFENHLYAEDFIKVNSK